MEDQAIVSLFLSRSEDAISQTAQKYGHYTKTIAYRILGNHEDAEEVENDTYLALWNSIPPQKPQNLKAYVARIARNAALSKWDYQTAQKRNFGPTEALDELAECIASDDTPEGELDKKMLDESINRFLLASEPTARQVFVRRYFYIDSITDIAARFDMSESRVKSILFRMRNRLKKKLEEEGLF